MIGVLELECALITKLVSHGLGGYRFGRLLIMFGRSKMKIALRIIALSLLLVLSIGVAQANELTIYPAKDQSAERQEKDKFECCS